MAKKNIDDYVQQLTEVGWFANMADKEAYIAGMKAKWTENNDGKCANTLPWVWFDSECVDNESAYKDLITEILESAKGNVPFSQVTEEWDQKTEPVSIKIAVTLKNGETLSATYEYESDYLNEDFDSFITGVVEKATDGKFTAFFKSTGGQDGLVLVADKDALTAAKKKRLLSA